jgi:hypothetical protein
VVNDPHHTPDSGWPSSLPAPEVTVDPLADLPPDVTAGRSDVHDRRWQTVTVVDLLPELACNHVAALLAAKRPRLSITDTWRRGWAGLDDERRVGCIDLMCAIETGRNHPSLEVVPADGGGVFLVGGPDDLELAFLIDADGQRIWLSLAT